MSESTSEQPLSVLDVEPLGDVEPDEARDQVVLPAGTYVVGDPCYTIPSPVWSEWLAAAGNDVTSLHHVLAAYVTVTTVDENGPTTTRHPCVGIHTAYGDGCYEDQDGRDYPVDAAMIGLVPADIFEDRYEGRVTNTVTFNGPVTCWCDEGVIHFEVATPEEGTGRSIRVVIDTDPPDPAETHCGECGNELRAGEYGICDECMERTEEDDLDGEDEK